MRPRFLGLLLPLPLLPFAACGGQAGCDDGIYTTPNAAYSGQYAATLTPRESALPAREFRLSVLPDGTIGGFVRDPAGNGPFGTEVAGRAAEVSNHCDDHRGTTISLDYTLPGGKTEHLAADRSARDSLAGTFAARHYADGDPTSVGTLALERVVQTGG